MRKFFAYSLIFWTLLGCSSHVEVREVPTSISNIQIEADENCDLERKE